jgi:hypothetical protein
LRGSPEPGRTHAGLSCATACCNKQPKQAFSHVAAAGHLDLLKVSVNVTIKELCKMLFEHVRLFAAGAESAQTRASRPAPAADESRARVQP